MKITVLNGSPKGDLSVTLQYIHFISKKFPLHTFSIHNVSQKIKSIEKKETAFDQIIEDVRNSDAVWWSVPIYVCLIPAQYKRFIELIHEKGAEESFRDKYTAVITTSIHFYDHTGNNYMHAVCDDLNMKYVDFFSPDMFDLLKEEHRKKLIDFAGSFFDSVTDEIPVTKSYAPVIYRDFIYEPENHSEKIDAGDKKVLILTDSGDENSNLGKMVERFRNSFSKPVDVVDISKLDIKGGCLGCIECGFDNRCTYTGKDDYIDFYNKKVKTADIIVYSGNIVDRYLSSDWKQFFDRRFFNTHIPTQTGKQLAYIISGPLTQVQNLRQVLTAVAEIDHANLTGIVTDEFGDSEQIDNLLQNLASKLVRNANNKYVKPVSFLGLGGRKIFRDDVWGRLRFPFIADHEYYEKNGFYDFPNIDPSEHKFSMDMIEAVKEPEAREMIRKMIKSQMVEPLKKMVETK